MGLGRRLARKLARRAVTRLLARLGAAVAGFADTSSDAPTAAFEPRRRLYDELEAARRDGREPPLTG